MRKAFIVGLTGIGFACSHAPKPVVPVVPQAIPHAEPNRFAVLVANFEGDEDLNADHEGDTTARLVASLERFRHTAQSQEREQFQLLRLGGIVDTSGRTNFNRGYFEHEQARKWLDKTESRMILWGAIRSGQTTRELVLRVTGSRERPNGNEYPMTEELIVPMSQLENVFPAIRLAVAIEASGYEDLRGLAVRDELPRLLEDNAARAASHAEILWAMAMQVASYKTGQVDLLRKCARILEEAAAKRNRQVDPVGWARLEVMRASVFADWDAFEANGAPVEQAISSYLRAAEELTMARAPYDFALVHNQLGLLYRRVGALSNSEASLCSAVNAFDKAAQVSYDADLPQYMDISLRGVQSSLSDLARRIPDGATPHCNPPISDSTWRTFQAAQPTRTP